MIITVPGVQADAINVTNTYKMNPGDKSCINAFQHNTIHISIARYAHMTVTLALFFKNLAFLHSFCDLCENFAFSAFKNPRFQIVSTSSLAQ